MKKNLKIVSPKKIVEIYKKTTLIFHGIEFFCIHKRIEQETE